MSAIDEMYEKYGVAREYYSFNSSDGNAYNWELNEDGNKKYNMLFLGKPLLQRREFTTEKQLGLIKFIMLHPDIDEVKQYYNEPSKTYNIRVFSLPDETGFRKSATECNNDLESCIAGMIVRFYDDLTPAQRQEVKEILER